MGNARYSADFKRDAVQQITERGYSTADVSRRLGVSCHSLYALQGIERAEFYCTGILTSIGILHEKGHPQPWIIAMDGKPTPAPVRDYGMRWGIEALFSDFKSRDFGITNTHLNHTKRIARLILVLTIALFFAVSTAMQPDENAPCLISLFKKGLRRIARAIANNTQIPKLWEFGIMSGDKDAL